MLTQFFHKAALATVIVTGLASVAVAQEVTIIAPAGPGSGYDQVARSVETVLRSQGLATEIQVVNAPGGTGLVGLAQFAAKHSADPNALLVSGFGMVSAGQLSKAAVTLADVTPAARLLGEYQAFAVAASSPIKSGQDLVAALKADPGKVTFAGGGVGASDHVAAGLFLKALGVEPVKLNFVAFTGGGEVVAAVLGGHVSVGVSGSAEFEALARSGELRIIGVTSEERLPGLDAPTFVEQGVDFHFQNWRMLAIGAKLGDEEKVAALERIENLAQSEAWAKEVETRGWQSTYLAGDDLTAFIESQTREVGALLTDIGLVK